MTRDHALDDPEVRADLARRDASERDRSRSRSDATWTAPAIVEHWPCTGCNTLVGMTRDAIDLHAMFNRQLERRGERPLAKRIPCADCKRKDEALAQAQAELRAAARRPHKQTNLAGIEPAAKGRP